MKTKTLLHKETRQIIKLLVKKNCSFHSNIFAKFLMYLSLLFFKKMVEEEFGQPYQGIVKYLINNIKYTIIKGRR